MQVVRREPFGASPHVGERGTTTHRAILDGALEMFRERGFHGTRVEHITEAAGCSRPSFYQYFSSKDDVFWHLAGQMAKGMDDVAGSIGPNASDPRGVADVERWLEMLIDVQIRYRPIVDAFPTAFREPTEQFTQASGMGHRLGSAIIASAPPTGRFPPGTAIAKVASTVTVRTIHHWQHSSAIPRPAFVTALAEMVHRLLHGPIAGVNTPPPSDPPPPRRIPVPTFAGTTGIVEPARPRGRATRDRLLASATTVLSRRGYHEARVDDIVQEAAVSHGTFYRYFTSKEELFGVVAEAAFRDLFELISSFPPIDALDELRSWLERYFESFRANGGIISAWQEIDLDDPALRNYTMDVSAAVHDHLGRIIATRGFGPSSIDALSLTAIIGQIPYDVIVLHSIDPDDAIDATGFLIEQAIFGLPA